MKKMDGVTLARLKLNRAMAHITEIEPYDREYAERSQPKIVVSAGKQIIHVSEQPPVQISILAGEAIYQIRSALDYLAFSLVERNINNLPLPDRWHERCLYPLWLTTKKQPQTFNCFASQLPGISQEAFEFIESAQPYNGGRIGNHLKLLAILSNIDKHRYLNLTPARIGHVRAALEANGAGQSSYTTMRDGDEIQESMSELVTLVPNATQYKQSFSAFTTFDESDLGYGAATLNVTQILVSCHNTVEVAVVPKFQTFLA